MSYKVVTPQLDSCLHTVHKVRVRYKKNKFVTPEYPSFVFINLRVAKEWATFLYRFELIKYQIWRCQTRGLRKARYILPLCKVRGLLFHFWNTILEHGEPHNSSKCRSNRFYIADSVMLTKQVFPK